MQSSSDIKRYFLSLEILSITDIKNQPSLVLLNTRGGHDGALFYLILKSGKIQVGRLSDQTIYNVFKKRQAEAGISEISPHDFRKAFISTIL